MHIIGNGNSIPNSDSCTDTWFPFDGLEKGVDGLYIIWVDVNSVHDVMKEEFWGMRACSTMNEQDEQMRAW